MGAQFGVIEGQVYTTKEKLALWFDYHIEKNKWVANTKKGQRGRPWPISKGDEEGGK